jgi:hypothetical protein
MEEAELTDLTGEMVRANRAFRNECIAQQLETWRPDEEELRNLEAASEGMTRAAQRSQGWAGVRSHEALPVPGNRKGRGTIKGGSR